MLAVAACTRAPDRSADTAAPAIAVNSPSPAPAPAPDPAKQPAALEVTERGLGPLQAGMSLAEASAALNGALVVPAGADTSACAYVQWRGGPSGVRVMIESGRIARIDVRSGSVSTEAGAHIGDTEERVSSLYAGRVTMSPHKYTKGHYMTVTPPAPADSAYRIVFETDGQRVLTYRSGRRHAVDYVEGCG